MEVIRLSDQRTDSSPLVLWDAYSPDAVLQPVWWNEAALLSHMLLPFGDRVAFGEASDQLHHVEGDGRIVPVRISRLSTSEEGPDKDCGYFVEPGQTVAVPMSAALFHWGWGLEVTAFLGHWRGPRHRHRIDHRGFPVPSGMQTRAVQFSGEVAETAHVTVPEFFVRPRLRQRHPRRGPQAGPVTGSAPHGSGVVPASADILIPGTT